MQVLNQPREHGAWGAFFFFLDPSMQPSRPFYGPSSFDSSLCERVFFVFFLLPVYLLPMFKNSGSLGGDGYPCLALKWAE